jgi:dihydrofolate reductase
MNHPEISLILARADNGVIGNDGGIPWHVPADLRRFKQITMGMPMIMGRKTFDSLPGLLPGRRHIVITRDFDWEEDGAEVVHSVEEALKVANAPHAWVIGGAETYRLFEPLADRIELTEVHTKPEGDASLPEFDATLWSETAREKHPAADGKPAFDWVTLKRKIL